MGDITIKFDFAELSSNLNEMARDQIPFASALALTRLAQEAQTFVRGDLPSHFIIRNGWAQRGIQVKAASKKDWPQAEAEVGTRDEFMARQMLGGVKTSLTGRQLAIPKAARMSPQALTPKSKWPSALLKKAGIFLQTPKTGNMAGRTAVFQRMRPSPWRYPLKTLYLFRGRISVKKRYDLEQTVEKIVASRYDETFGKALAYAIHSGLANRRR